MIILDLIFESESSVGLVYTVKYKKWWKERSIKVWIGKWPNGTFYPIADSYDGNLTLPFNSIHIKDIILHKHENN